MSGDGPPRWAHLKLAAGAVLISFSPVWVTLADVAPSVSAFYRVFLGGLILWFIVGVRRHSFRPSRPVLVLTGVIGFLLALDLWSWHQSILYIGPGLSTILGNLEVFIVAAVGILFLGERLTGRFAAGVLIATVGLFLIFGLDWSQLGTDYKIGIALGFLTAILYSAVVLGVRSVQLRPGSLGATATMAWISTATALTLAVWIGGSGGSFAIPNPKTGTALVAYALVSHVVGWVMIADALPKVQASRAGLLLLIQPSLAFVWDVVFFARPTTSLDVMGAALALGAIYLGSKKSPPR